LLEKFWASGPEIWFRAANDSEFSFPTARLKRRCCCRCHQLLLSAQPGLKCWRIWV
jgi:hypothetical protein